MYLYIANDEDGSGCDIIAPSECTDPATAGTTGQDFTETFGDPEPLVFAAGAKTVSERTSAITSIQDFMVEGDEKIYLALCPRNIRAQCDESNLLATAYVTIMGEQVYVDNTGNTATTTNLTHPDNDDIGSPCNSTPCETKVAGAFTTGSDPDGYRLNNVKLKFANDGSSTDDDPMGVIVGLYENNSSGLPGKRIDYLCFLKANLATDCSVPENEIAEKSEAIFTKPEGILLDPGTQYWVEVEGVKGLLEVTTDHGETTRVTGWTIENKILRSTQQGTTNWETNTSRSLIMEVSGIPRGGVVVDTDPNRDGAQTSLRVDENGTATYSVRLDSPPLDETVIMAASGDRSVATISPKSLTFEKGNCNTPTAPKKCWWEPHTVTVKGGFVGDNTATDITHAVSSVPSVQIAGAGSWTA